MSNELSEFVEFAESLADISRDILRGTMGRAPDYEIKEDGSPVTPIDQQIERVLRRRIADRYPDHGILGEEFDNKDLEAEFVWVIDPIDGTKQYIAGVPVFSTLIGLAQGGRFIYGVMEFPATGDRWCGGPDLGSTLNGKTVHARTCGDLDQALIGAGMPTLDVPDEREAVFGLTETGLWTVWGASSYAFGLIASGRMDLAVYRGVDQFDYAAAVAVVEGAGGHCCDWKGQPLTLNSGSRVLLLGDAALTDTALLYLAL